MALVQRVFVSLDCSEPAPLAEFWAGLLGGEIAFTTTNAVAVRSESVWLTAIRDANYRPPTWPGADVPKQIHLDLGVANLDEAVAAAERLGARVAAVQPSPDRWRVLLDPAGHPFCVTTQIPRAQG